MRSPDWLTARPYAHRGLHGPCVIENSRGAFRAAIDAGWGIELDVQASRSGTAYVFHDATLDRLCGRTGAMKALDDAAAACVLLRGTRETIPTLADVMRLVGGRAPMLIELKGGGRSRTLCRSVAALLDDYRGAAAIMSFDPAMVRWFARERPKVIRGVVMSEEGRRKMRDRAVQHLAVRLARPDFLAYDIRSLPSPFAGSMRAAGLPILSWTVRSPDEEQRAAVHADQIIHELPLRP